MVSLVVAVQRGVQPTVAACSAAIASCDRQWEQALMAAGPIHFTQKIGKKAEMETVGTTSKQA